MALKSEKLDSGLTVYVDHMPNARTNSTNMFIPYGSVNELEGDEGMAHAFEHCVHLETDQFANRTDLARHAKLHGMQTNANTYYTRTVYYANSIELEPAMVHLSQILQHTHFPEEGVAHEMKAIRREAATGLDAVAQLHVKARDYAVFGKPYGRAVIGYHDKLDFTADKMTQLHAQQYKLGNMALVVAGAAKLDQVIDLANNYFVQDADDTLPRQSELGVELEEYHTTGLVRGDSSNVRINVSYPFPSEFREKFNRERLAYGMAATAISDVCFREMRYEKGISYDGSVSFSTYNHPNAWALTGGVTTDKESLNVANGVFDDIFSRRGSDYDDDALTGALQMYKYYFNLKVGSLDDRVSSHIGRLQEYRQPEDLSTILRRVKKVRIQDIREAIDDLADIAQSTPRYTHLTGARDAIGDVERIIDQSEFA